MKKFSVAGFDFLIKGSRGDISSDHKEACPTCGETDCYSHGNRREASERARFNGAIDGVEGLLLALGCAGYNLEERNFAEAVQSALDGISNNLGE